MGSDEDWAGINDKRNPETALSPATIFGLQTGSTCFSYSSTNSEL